MGTEATLQLLRNRHQSGAFRHPVYAEDVAQAERDRIVVDFQQTLQRNAVDPPPEKLRGSDHDEDRLDEPKQCSKCKKTFPRGDFPCALASGRLVVRSWCTGCLNAYNRATTEKRRRKRVADRLAKKGIVA